MASKLVCVVASICLFANLAWARQAEENSLRIVQRQFLDSVKPILKQSCGDCHWGTSSEAELDFAKYETIDQLLGDSAKWKKVLRRISDGQMPPEDAEPLSESDKSRLLTWLDHLLNTVDCSNIDPGRVTIRRLNRTEYRNTIRDLTGVDYRPSENFPGDDVGYGFDNIADVLSLPPILMEKYLDAAESIITDAIVDPATPQYEVSIAGNKFRGGSASAISNATRCLFSNSRVFANFDVPKTGDYVIRVRAFGDQVEGEPCKMAIGSDRKDVEFVDVSATEDEAGDYQTKVALKAGRHRLSLAFLNDFYDPDKNLDRNLYIVRAWISGPVNISENQRAIMFVDPGDTPSQQANAARVVLHRFASRAFRRPVSDEELDRLVGLYLQSRADGDSFEAAIGWTLQAILVSPHFLYKIEIPPPDDLSHRLSAYETATALSYFLWSTMPDEELFELADSGQLNKPEVYREQVTRLLEHNRIQALVENFAAQWLQLRSLQDAQPDPELFPGVDAALRNDMIEETKLLFADWLRRDGSVLELLNARHTFLNQRLAEHYGLDNVEGDEFVKVNLDGNRRGGLLTQASILTLTSNPTRTSPVRRGKWVMENLLGEQPPPPDPSVMALDDQPELTGSLRQRMEQHRKNPACASCHLTMDALGFSLEHYDAVGRWRDQDGEFPIDAMGELPDGTKFSGADGLQQLFSTQLKDKFLRCFTEKLLIYALGRGLEYYDECTVDKILETAEKDDFRMSAFIHAISECEPFLNRRGNGGEKSE
jgi:hypothetical protein